MPDKIGKYEVLERIGRGGMGTIFKARDPVLDRLVALKVISNEIEVTDELRARFYREAQACARLNHPNIVTVYDMGEDDGRLYIVMEFLEGDEVKRLIAQRTALAIEDKLSLMMQVCDGLFYAHQKGIVHRDIKPSNVMLLRSGQAKILDFGIAQIANTEGGLTRTGLIMGTLRYISPEQVRGRADHRSDMFSAGAVFYEFLSWSPPFTGEDPMQILEQLRTEDPPPLVTLDPSIPPDLAAVVERAMRKNPAERFPDLQEMRLHLEQVQQRLAEEGQRVRARVRAQRDRVGKLEAELAARVGAARGDVAPPRTDDTGRLATLQKLEGDLAARIDTLQALIASADALAPAFERATHLHEAGEFADAVAEFEAIVADMPEHVHALEGLERARAQVEEQRRRQLADQLLTDARGALGEGGLTLCLELIKQAEEISPPADVLRDLHALRDTAEAALTAREALRRARREADRARELMTQARDAAQTEAAQDHAAGLWQEVEARYTAAQDAYGREAYDAARAISEEAATGYRRVEAAARDEKQRARKALDSAREQVARQQERARAADALRFAPDLWSAAEAKLAEAQSAFGKGALRGAAAILTEAATLLSRAETSAVEARQRERRHAAAAREQTAEARRAAQAEGAREHAPTLWDAAEARFAEAERAFERETYETARQGFEAAAIDYRRFEETAREARRRQREAAEAAREQMTQSRARAETAGAVLNAREQWNAAEAKSKEAQDAFERHALAAAAAAFTEAAARYGRAVEAAGEARRREERSAQESRDHATQGRERARAASAARYGRESWDAAEARFAEGQASLDAAPARAGEIFREAGALYAEAERLAALARQRARHRAEAARALSLEAQRRAEALGAAHGASERWTEAASRSAEGVSLIDREEYAQAVETFDQAVALYRQAASEAEDVWRRAREQAEQGREAMAACRESALAVDALSRAPVDWNAAESHAASGAAAMAREAYADARQAFDQGTSLYRQAEAAAREIVRGLEIARADAEKSRDAAALARRTASEARASRYAASEWRTGESTEAEANAALSRQDYAAARSLFAEARRQFAVAARAAGIAAEAGTRRADAMVGDARRLLGSGDLAGCLRRVNEVLALKPDHAAADQLRIEVEERLRAEEVASIPPAPPQTDQTLSAIEAPTLVDAPVEAPTIIESPTVIEDATVLAKPPAVDAPTTVARAVIHDVGGETVFVEPPRAPTSDDDRTVLAASGPVPAAPTVSWKRPAPVRHPDTPSAKRSRWPVAAAVVGGVAAAGLIAAFLLTGRAPESNRKQEKLNDFVQKKEQSSQPPVKPVEPPRQVAQVEAKVRAAETRSASARQAAEGANAPKLAAAVWGKATASQGKAEDALRQGGFEQAEASFNEAEKGYREAQNIAIAAAPKPGRDEADKARAAVAPARREAEQAGAPRRAPITFATAQRKEKEADDLLKRDDFSSAQLRYKEAADGYRQAGQQAAGPLPIEQRKEVEAARASAEGARRAAEQAEAPRHAAERFRSAQTKMSDARAAFDRGDYKAAAPLFGGAQGDYQQAKLDADRTIVLERDRGEAQRARDSADAARRAVEQGDAPRHAPERFKAAQTKMSEARAALDRGDYKGAIPLFGGAQAEYQQAKLDADRTIVLERDRGEAQRARDSADAARRAAEQGDAPRHAAERFKSAQTKMNDGRAAFDRADYKAATPLFSGAQTEFQQARVDAQARLDAEQLERQAQRARENADTARRAAEQARAPRYASERFRSAQAKESEASAALGRADYKAAASLSSGALGEYQVAKQEAEQKVAVLKSGAEEARNTATSRRDEAVKVGGERLAKDLFNAAKAKHSEADGLMSSLNFESATPVYQDAATRYTGARDQAQGENKKQADGARSQMFKAKERANQNAAEFREAKAREDEGDVLYRQLAYTEAAEKFRSAEALFGKAEGKAPPSKRQFAPPSF